MKEKPFVKGRNCYRHNVNVHAVCHLSNYGLNGWREQTICEGIIFTSWTAYIKIIHIYIMVIFFVEIQWLIKRVWKSFLLLK